MNSITIAIDEEIHISSPYEILTYTDKIFISCMYEGLVSFDLKGNIVPASCNEYIINEDRTKFIFKFYDKKWSNSDLIRASDFEKMFKTIIYNASKYSCVELLMPIKNVFNYLEGNQKFNQIGIKVVDDNTLEIELEYPNEDFLSILACPMFVPIHSSVTIDSCFSITNGKYYLLTMNNDNNDIVLQKNQFFNTVSNIDILKLRFVKDFASQMKMYNDDEIQITCNTLYNEAIKKEKTDEINYCKLPLIYYLFINDGNKEIFDLKTRHIIFNMIQKVNFSEYAVGITNNMTLIPRSIWNLEVKIKDNEPKYIQKNLKLRLLYANYYPNKIVATIIKEKMKSIGIEIELIEESHVDIYHRINEKKYDIALAILSLPCANLSCILNLFLDNESLEERIDEYSELLESYYFSRDGEKTVYINKMLEILHDKLPLLPICEMGGIYFMKKNISGFYYKKDGLPTIDTLLVH